MKVYRSKIFECLHEDFKTHLKFGGITQADMDEFEKDCFKEVPDVPPARAARRPALSAAGPGTRGGAKPGR
jgi:DNA-binding transcriptional regulator YiaG